MDVGDNRPSRLKAQESHVYCNERGKQLTENRPMKELDAPSAEAWDVFGGSYLGASSERNDKNVSRAGCKAAPCRYDSD